MELYTSWGEKWRVFCYFTVSSMFIVALVFGIAFNIIIYAKCKKLDNQLRQTLDVFATTVAELEALNNEDVNAVLAKRVKK